MIRIEDILRFKKELFFEGAVQLDWFYDTEKKHAAASSFVFHGPEYFGVSQDDIRTSRHDLVDTCTFAQMLGHRLYLDGEDNPLIMAVAGYGSGKSHLGLTLASLFGSLPKAPLTTRILNNIYAADKATGEELKELINRPNLVIALNGMKDFNLTYEILNSARKALREHGVDESPLREITRAYEVARTFLRRNFDLYSAEFEKLAARDGIELKDNALFSYLDESLDSDTGIFEVVNEVYEQATGISIRWDDGISAGDVLSKLQEAFCGDRGAFNKILILFDEFGRFVEFAAEYPTRAGQSAIQQVFEAIQNANKDIVFVGFIQSDLRTYLARVEKSSNIIRYVGRYEASDKVYLSSNLETIFANLIERKDEEAFKKYIQGDTRNWRHFHSDLLCWLPTASERSLWADWSKFSKVILEGTYPLHPLTTWMLANLGNWLQQRSSLTFLSNEFQRLADNYITEQKELPLIYPTRLIRSDFFNELLRAEEEGRQQSEYCILYNQVLRKHRDKCSDQLLDVLAANLVLRIGKLKTTDRMDVTRALSYCLSLDEATITESLYELENELGVISFDDDAGCFDFIEDATGAKDFRRFVTRVRSRTPIYPSLAFQNNELRNLLGIDGTIITSFSTRNSIRTNEWQFSQEILHIADIDSKTITGMRKDWLNATSPEKQKGKLVWVYMGPDDQASVLTAIQEEIRSSGLDCSPVVFFLIDDNEGIFLNALRDITLVKHFSSEDRARYARFIPDFAMKAQRAAEDAFKQLASKRMLITGSGIQTVRTRIAEFCNERFEQVYPKVISFPFEGFHNKNIAPARKLLAQIAKNLLTGKMDYQSVQAQNRDFKNRVEAVLVTDRHASWGVLTSEIQLVRPENTRVAAIYEELDHALEESGELAIKSTFEKYLAPPYGLNEFSLGLLIACYISFKGQGAKIRLEENIVRTLDWAERTYLERGIDFRVLENSHLVKVNVDEYFAKYTSLCDQIETTTDIEEAYNLVIALADLKKEQEVPPTLEYRVKISDVYLAECSRAYPAVVRELESLHDRLERSLERGNIKQLLDIVNSAEGIMNIVPGSSRYRYSPSQKTEFSTIADKARAYIETNYESWLSSLRCESVASVTSFEGSTRALIRSLNELGYHDFARKTQSRLDNILADMRHIRMLQTIREQIEAFLQDCKPSGKATYDQLGAWKNKGLELEGFIITHRNLSEKEIEDYQARIRSKLDAVEKAFEELYQQITDAYDIGFNLETVDDCNVLLSKIGNVLSRNIKAEDRESLSNMEKETQTFLDSLMVISSPSIGRYALREAIHNLNIIWNGDETELDFSQVLQNYWLDKAKVFDDADTSWATKFMIHESMINNWDANQCLRWQEDTKLLPNFLRDETIACFEEVRALVDARLSELDVIAVLTMFEKLTKEQKQVCLEKLMGLRPKY